jgi:hypothetical protein
MTIQERVCIMMRSRREPPLSTLENFHIPRGFFAVIVADPSVYKDHIRYYRKHKNIGIERGVVGLSPQSFVCYTAAHRLGFPWYFRIDDDLTEGYFIHKDGRRLGLKEPIFAAYTAAIRLKVSLVGFAKTSNRFWMKPGAGRAFGLIHGGAALFRSTRKPRQYIDPGLPLYDDVWQSLSHRAECGAVGRVREIGLDLLGSAETVTEGHGRERLHYESRKRILAEWSDFASCEPQVFYDKWGKICLPWKFHRHAEFSAKVPT